jgi:mRNA-degrading endonuclease RelE of RelBE toxin-antitoxin system
MRILLHHTANKYLNRLTPEDKARFNVAFQNLAKEPPQGDIKSYVGVPGVQRLHVGNYRALFKIEDNIILVTHIEQRGQAYTKKTRNRRG